MSNTLRRFIYFYLLFIPWYHLEFIEKWACGRPSGLSRWRFILFHVDEVVYLARAVADFRQISLFCLIKKPRRKSCRRRQSRRFVFSSSAHFSTDFSSSLCSRCCSSYRSVKSHVCNIFKLKICSGREWGRARMIPTWVASSLWWARDDASDIEAEKRQFSSSVEITAR